MALSAKVDRVEVVQAGDTGIDHFKARFSQFSKAQHAEYTILVMLDRQTIETRKRFSEFAVLHDQLSARFSLGFDLPAKTPIRYFNADKLENRKEALNAYLKEVCRRGDICQSQEVQSFFGLQGQGKIGDQAPVSQQKQQSNNTYQGRTSVPQPERPKNKIAGTRHDEEDELIGWDN
jgi:hypothetical protein